MPVSQSVKRLFSEYEKAFSALDLQKSAGFFAESFISAGPNGTITQSKSEFLKEAHKATAFYRSVRTEISENPLDRRAVHHGEVFVG